jgi:putative polyhydroxyalkanoate system protein
MATVRLTHTHHLPAADAQARVATLFGEYGRRYGLEHRWEGNVLHLTGSGISGVATIGAHEVTVEVRLALAIAPLKRQVAAGIEAELAKHLE